MSSDQKTTTTTTTSSTDATPVFQLNQKKLKELAENANAIKIGGKVFIISYDEISRFVTVNLLFRVQLVVRRKLFTVQQMQMIKKLQSSLKKLAANNIQGIEEV